MPPAPRRAGAGSSIPHFDRALIAKYDGAGPRYTSYPTADRFGTSFTAQHYAAALQARNRRSAESTLSLYVHLPFCDTICYYCACNKVITANHHRSGKYVRYLGREIGIVAGMLAGPKHVQQLHWGGGTPTFLARSEMASLMAVLRDAFTFAEDSEISIEVDPRKVDAETIEFVRTQGFNRLSIGIQDFDPAVQEAVNRVQSEAQTLLVMDAARRSGFASINVDLIYGLPRQSVAGFGVTLGKVIAASPDRIALYGYAHVPQMFKAQRRIVTGELPSAEARLAIMQAAIGQLTGAGYVYVGMDHFARPEDELAVALREGKLHRNFQGYSTRPDCDLLAFGISAIGKVGPSYVQNMKTLDEYYACLDAHALPVMRGYELDADDLLRRDVIQALMCEFRIDLESFGRKHGIDVTQSLAPELATLAPLAADGLVVLSPKAVEVTPRGRLLVRSIAMIFDRYLQQGRERARYSRVI